MGASYDQLLQVARAAESSGFDAFFRSDHYLTMGGDGLPGPTDAWITLAGLARETTRIRLGTLVTSATFRLPGILAITVAQVDAMSGGRIELGLGTGWYEGEHTAYGIPFPPLGERFERLEEQLSILTGLWATPVGQMYSFAGTHYRLTTEKASRRCPSRCNSRIRPSSSVVADTPGHPPWPLPSPMNSTWPFTGWTTRRPSSPWVRAACESVGRDPAALRLSAAQVVCCGTDEAEVARRAKAIGREVGELRTNGAAGTPLELVERLRALGAAGADTVYLQVLDLNDLDHLRLLGEQVLPHLA